MNKNPCDTAYGIGIDTGGTYTDAVLYDMREHQVVNVSKRPTIHHCLELSIVQALDDIFPVGEAEAVRKIAFSTTLATNAIAEGRMTRVGLIVIGRVKSFDAPVVSIRYVEGGHDHLGKELTPLNVDQIVGSLVGGFIEAFVSRERLVSFLPKKGWLTVCLAAGAGIVFPVCECAVVPVVRRLTGKGLPFSAAIAYLLGGPIVNPIVAASTALAYAFDWRIVILRLGLGYALAVAIGMLMGKLFAGIGALRDNGDALENSAPSCGCRHHPPERTDSEAFSGTAQPFVIIPNQAGVDTGCLCGCNHPASDRWIDKAGAGFTHAMDDFLAVGHYLVIGAFIAALAQTHIDRSSFLSLTASPILSVVLMMALAIMLNLCSEADAFIAASFRGLMPIPAQMAFLLAGPMFDLKLLLMYQSIFKRKTIVVLSSVILTAVLITTLGLEMLNGVLQ